MASSSAITTRVGTGGDLRRFSVGSAFELGGQPVEQLVLVLLETLDTRLHFAPVAQHGIRVALGLPVLALGQWGLGHEGPQTGVVGLFGELPKLLVGDDQLLAELAQPVGELRQATFDERAGHGRGV